MLKRTAPLSNLFRLYNVVLVLSLFCTPFRLIFVFFDYQFQYSQEYQLGNNVKCVALSALLNFFNLLFFQARQIHMLFLALEIKPYAAKRTVKLLSLAPLECQFGIRCCLWISWFIFVYTISIFFVVFTCSSTTGFPYACFQP